MATERGEFTRKFDRDILGDESAAAEEAEAQRLLAEQQDQALEREFQKVQSVLEYRAQWLKERFPECEDKGGQGFRGRRFEFRSANSGKMIGWIEFRIRLTDSQQGIVVESTMELEGHFPRRHDYVNFPKENLSLEKAKRFVESKLMEFAGPYQDSQGT